MTGLAAFELNDEKLEALSALDILLFVLLLIGF